MQSDPVFRAADHERLFIQEMGITGNTGTPSYASQMFHCTMMPACIDTSTAVAKIERPEAVHLSDLPLSSSHMIILASPNESDYSNWIKIS